MTLLYDDRRASRKMALNSTRNQAQAGAERSQADSYRYNGALMRKNVRLVRLLTATR